jgi:hypothetical protein
MSADPSLDHLIEQWKSNDSTPTASDCVGIFSHRCRMSELVVLSQIIDGSEIDPNRLFVLTKRYPFHCRTFPGQCQD